VKKKNDTMESTNCGGHFANNAMINITALLVKTTTNITFAGESFTLAPYTIKLTMRLANWPFVTIFNKLAISIDTTAASTAPCGGGVNVQSGTGGGGNLKWYSYNTGSSTLYGTFNQKAEVDTQPKLINMTIDPMTSRITMRLPFFWETAVIDPNYNVLVSAVPTPSPSGNGNECSQNTAIYGVVGLDILVIIGVTVSIAGFVLIVAAAVFYVKMKTRIGNVKRLRTRFATMSDGNL